MQIAIDGPSSSGKSTVAKQVARKLQYIYCDTGAMYRAVTVLAKQHHLDYGAEAAILALLKKTKISFQIDDQQNDQLVFLGEQDVTRAIRTSEITNNVSQVSALPKIRAELVRQQRLIAQGHDIVMDGRDIGTTVLPHAELKVFMTATVNERAKRRYLENTAKGMNTPLAQLQDEIKQRDYKDSHRQVSPLKQAQDAISLDTTNLTIDQVVAKIVALAKNCQA